MLCHLPEGKRAGVVVVDILPSRGDLGVLIGQVPAAFFRAAAGPGEGEQDLPQQDVQLHLVERLSAGVDVVGLPDQRAQTDGGGIVGGDLVLEEQRIVVKKVQVLGIHRLPTGVGNDGGEENEEEILRLLSRVGDSHVVFVVVGDENISGVHRVDFIQIYEFALAADAQADLMVAVPVHAVPVAHYVVVEQVGGENGVKFILPVETSHL